MSYTLNKTDGTILTELVDGILDTDTTDVALVGKDFTGYGEFINENFIKILENFSNATEPLAPLRGQIWYDTSVEKLKVFNGNEFTPAAGSFVGTLPPTNPISGDTWYNSFSNQLYLYDGDEFRLVGPQYAQQQGESGLSVRTVQDTNLNSRTVLELRVGTTLQAVVSRERIVPNNSSGNIIPELVTTENPNGTIYPGINVVNSYDFQYRGTATRAQNLIIDADPESEFSAEKVLRNDQNGRVFGNLTLLGQAEDLNEGILSSDPELVLGEQAVNISLLDIDDTNRELVLKTNSPGNNIRLVVTREEGGNNVPVDALTIKSQGRFVGIFKPEPAYTLDVDGSARISGDLIVKGGNVTTSGNTIELAATDTISDETANGGGITLKGDTDKTFNWYNDSDSWTSSEHLDLADGKEYRINNTTVLTSNSLGTGVISATGITQVGTLKYVDINTIRIGATADDPDNPDNQLPIITRTDNSLTGLTIDVNTGDIDVSNSKITKLQAPESDNDASNKKYVDLQIEKALLVFSVDVTGWDSGNVNDNLIAYLTAVSPPRKELNGKEASIITTRISSTTLEGINVMADTNINYAEVLVGPSPLTDVSQITRVEVVEDIALPYNLSVPYTPTIVREIRHFIVNIVNDAGEWVSNSSKPPETV